MMRPTINEESDCLRKKICVAVLLAKGPYYPDDRNGRGVRGPI
jgi:hypothetical protein